MKKNNFIRFNIDVLLEKVSNIQTSDFIQGNCSIPTQFLKAGNSNYITEEDELIIQKHFTNFSISTIEVSSIGVIHWKASQIFFTMK